MYHLPLEIYMRKNSKKSTPKNELWPGNFLFTDVFLQFIEPIPEAVIFSDIAGKILQVNQEACRIFGYTRHELMNLMIEDLVPNSIRDRHSQLRRSFFENPRPRYMRSRDTLSFKHKQGHSVPMEAALFCINSDQGPLAVNLIRNVSELKSHIDQLTEYGLFDELTALHNRRFVMEELKIRLSQLGRSKEKLALLFIDIDQFKPVNDTYGHDFGDALLIEIGKRLKNTLRESDFLGRLGGDEFCLILDPFTNLIAAKVLANTILTSLKHPILIRGITLNITASIGIASTTEGFLNVETLISAADKAMYQAKKQGGDQFEFATSTHSQGI